MRTLRTWVGPARLLGPAVAGLLLAGTLAPAPASADTDLDVGGTAVIAYANGDNVRLRTGPSYDTGEIDRYPEGTQVQVLDGTSAASDGTTWYQVSIDGQTGYVVSDYLASSSGLHTGTSGRVATTDAVHVRSGPSTADSVVTTIPAGEVVTLTGGESDGWRSVSATGGDGWIYGAFLGAGEPSGEVPSPGSGDGGIRYTIDSVHLRAGPDTSSTSLANLPVGVALQFTGSVENGFAEVSSDYGSGWVFAQYIDANAPADPGDGAGTTPDAPENGNSGETGARYTIDTVHLRTGPSTNTDSLTYLEAGVELQLLGEVENGFVRVSSPFGEGWVYAAFLGAERSPAPETPAAPEAPEPVARYTIAAVNLRDGATLGSEVLQVVALGAEVSFLGETENGFARVASEGVQGWIAAQFLAETPPEVPDPGPAPSNALVTWPVSGGEWFISQGYNGSSHQNRSSSWQYYYSLDLKRTDGNTAGQPVYSAVNGTIRWIDESTGGMSISMGEGLAYAFFHVRLDPSLSEGDTVTQGQVLGTIAPAGEAGNGGSPHLHITVWETTDEGNWSRSAIPFTGRVAIEGISFPATGAGNDYRGYAFNP